MEKDNMTGLYKKSSLLDCLEDLLKRSKVEEEGETGGKRLFSIALLDFDNFRKLNDSLGHLFGDKVITETASIIRAEMGETGKAGRHGGDEFLLVFENTSFEQTFIILENIRREIRSHMFEVKIDDKHIKSDTSCSIGMASYPNDGGDVQEVLRSADEALYRAKSEGRDRICIAIEEKKIPKTIYFTRRQIERIAEMAARLGKTESALYREGADHIINYYLDVIEKKNVEGRIRIQVGSGLLNLMEATGDNMKEGFIAAVNEARGRLFRETGLQLPGVRLQDNPELADNEIAFIVNDKEFNRFNIDVNEKAIYSTLVRLILDNLGKVMLEI
jgi:diguanylate cyclase (GGDEF)-like protein